MKTSQWKFFLMTAFWVMFLMNVTNAYSQTCSLQADSVNDVVPEQNFSIPIRINDAPNQMDSFGFRMSYDSSKLVYTGYTRGDLTANFDYFDANLFMWRIVIVGGFEIGEDVIAEGASGVLINLNFKALKPRFPGGRCSQIEIYDEFDGIYGWKICRHEEVCYESECGEVCYETECEHDGDVNEDGSVTPADAQLVFQHYLGIITLDECQQAHADVNEDGSVTPADAECIFQKYQGQPSCLD